MEADTTLMAILTGGVYTSAGVGRDGITRTSAEDAFDTNGFLQPAALVKQRGNVPDNQVVDQMEQHRSATQVTEIYVYQDTGFDQIDLALARLYVLFEGYTFSGAFPAEWVNTIDREQDEGALQGASLARIDFLVADIQGA
jgi:hypothetical protein